MINKSTLIPIFVDVERNIDGRKMIRCSYYSVQSDEPLPNWVLDVGEFKSQMLMLNLEAILVGSIDNPNSFNNTSDLSMLFDSIESREDLFIDINEIWVPKEWFGNILLAQGMVFRITQNRFSLCWKLRNDRISMEEFYREASLIGDDKKKQIIQKRIALFSEIDTQVFYDWTKLQIEESRINYKENNKKALNKIIQ